MSTFHAAYSFGSILASLASAVAVPRMSLVAFFGLVTLVGVASLSAVFPLLSWRPTARDESTPAATAQRIDSRLWIVCAAVTCLFIVDSSVANWSAVYLTASLAGPASLAALGYGCYAAATLLGRTAGDKLVERFGPATVVRAGGALAAVGLGVVISAREPVNGLVGFAVLGLGLAVVVPQAYSAAGAASENPEAAVARVNTFTYAGFVIGAPVVGIAAEIHSLRSGFVVTLLLTVCIVLAAPSFVPTAGRPPAVRTRSGGR
jgi:MFS family permease